MKTNKLRDLIRETIKEINGSQTLTKDNFDSRLNKAMSKSGFGEKERNSFFSKDTPSTMGVGGVQKARTLVSTLRSDYREMSDDELDEFSAEMVEHFLDNTAAQARAKVFFAKKGI